MLLWIWSWRLLRTGASPSICKAECQWNQVATEYSWQYENLDPNRANPATAITVSVNGPRRRR
jgi:hypothetical protein